MYIFAFQGASGKPSKVEVPESGFTLNEIRYLHINFHKLALMPHSFYIIIIIIIIITFILIQEIGFAESLLN